MRLKEPGQHGSGGLLRRAQAVIAIDQTYGTLDWYDLPSSFSPTPPPFHTRQPNKCEGNRLANPYGQMSL